MSGIQVSDPVVFTSFIPVWLVDVGATAILLIVIGGMAYRIKRWHTGSIPPGLVKDIPKLGTSAVVKIFLKSLVSDGLAVSPLYARYKRRWSTHLLIFAGFVGLMLTTTFAYITNPMANPMPFTWWVRILGNVSGGLLVLGATIAAAKMATDSGERNRLTEYVDMAFMGSLYVAAATGFVTEFVGYGADSGSGYFIYGVHLIAVSLLLATAPFTRFVHSIQAPYMALFERYRLELVRRGFARSYKDDRMGKYMADTFFQKEEIQRQESRN